MRKWVVLQGYKKYLYVRFIKGYAYANPNGTVSFHVVNSLGFRSLWIELIFHYYIERESNPLILLIASHFTCILQSARCKGRFIISKEDTQYWKSRMEKPAKACNYSSTHTLIKLLDILFGKECLARDTACGSAPVMNLI